MGALDPRLWLALIVGFIASIVSAYFYGVNSANAANEAKANKAIVAYMPKVQAKEAEASKQIQGVGNETETKLAALQTRFNTASAELSRLRVKRPACNVPEGGTGPGARDAASATAERTDRLGAGEVNLDDVASEVIQLGKDYDAANIRIGELVSLVHVYEKACKVE